MIYKVTSFQRVRESQANIHEIPLSLISHPSQNTYTPDTYRRILSNFASQFSFLNSPTSPAKYTAHTVCWIMQSKYLERRYLLDGGRLTVANSPRIDPAGRSLSFSSSRVAINSSQSACPRPLGLMRDILSDTVALFYSDAMIRALPPLQCLSCACTCTRTRREGTLGPL